MSICFYIYLITFYLQLESIASKGNQNIGKGNLYHRCFRDKKTETPYFLRSFHIFILIHSADLNHS